MSDIRTVEGIFKDLMVDLTQEEIIHRSAELAETVFDKTVAEDNKKASAKEFKDQIDAMTKKTHRLAIVVRDGRETRSVECYQRFDYKNNSVETFRKDTGASIGSRGMSADERQLDLDEMPKQDEALR